MSTELEIDISPAAEPGALPRGPRPYRVSIGWRRAADSADNRTRYVSALLDLDALAPLEDRPDAYGRMLTDFAFGGDERRDAVISALNSPDGVRARLVVAPDASELLSLRWEMLLDPRSADAALLATSPSWCFSRYLSSFDWRPVRLVPRRTWRALIVIASPASLPEQGLAPLPVDLELARARQALGPIAAERVELVTGGARAPSLAEIGRALREGVDLLYLVCHGEFERGQAALYLEGEAGAIARVAGADLIEEIRLAPQRPILVVCGACSSAGAGAIDDDPDPTCADGSPLAALAPRLMALGVPAVVGMQGRVTLATLSAFLDALLRELAQDGDIDRSIAAARAAVRARRDAWRPVLYSRLRRGRVFYEPALMGAEDAETGWTQLAERLSLPYPGCVCVIGPGVLDSVVDSRRRIAQKWAEENRFPLAPWSRDSLPDVAQYVVKTQRQTVHLGQRYCQELLRQCAQVLGEAPPTQQAAVTVLNDKLRQVRAQRGAEEDVYARLARLPIALYLSTTGDDLLTQALTDAGRQPVAAALPWRRGGALPGLPDPWRERPGYEPSVAEPLVYHMFGTFKNPLSLVLTEDDHLDFLLDHNSKEVIDRFNAIVTGMISSSSLLFLGFQLDTIEFRTIFRAVSSRVRMPRQTGPHIAAQIEPEEGRTLDPGGARDYFQRTLKDSDVSVYWGQPERFLGELLHRLGGANP